MKKPGKRQAEKIKMPKGLSSLVILVNLILLLFIIFAAASIFFGVNNKRLKSLFPAPKPPPSLAPTVKPTPTLVPLVQGPQTYSISKKDGIPNMYELNLNTIDPKKGETQKVDLKIKDDMADVVSATAKIKTESRTFLRSLALSKGTARDGAWSGEWVINDGHDRKFMITFEATDQAGNKSSLDFTIR